MSTPSTPLLRLCHFDDVFLQLQPYYCYNEEVCCKEGCCSKHDLKYFSSLRFWYKIYIVLGILALLFLYRCICWCCRKRPTNTVAVDDADTHAMNLMESYNNRNNGAPKNDPPPLYSIAVNLPKPTNHDEVPTYEQATSMK